MKRSSNRLVLLVGIFLAVVAFVLIAIMLQGNGPGGSNGASAAPTTAKVVVAAKDLSLGSLITADAVTTKDVDVATKPADSYSDVSFVIGQTVRQPLKNGQLITSAILNGGGSVANISVPAGLVGIAVQVDQITGVGTLIKPGDHVDVVTGFTAIPEVVYGKESSSPTPRSATSAGPSASAGVALKNVDGTMYNPNSIKTIVEGLVVVGTLLPPATQDPAASGQTQGGNTSLNGQQEIVILGATVQQAEAIRYAQVDGTIALVLRSAADCQAPDGTATACPIIPTTGITLRKMIDDFGVLPPQVVEVLEPTPYPSPLPIRLYPSPSPSPSPLPSGSAAPSASAGA